MGAHVNPKTLSTNTVTTVVGSTAAIVGIGAALSAAAAPVAALALAGVGTAVAAGALYKKLTGPAAQPEQATKDGETRRRLADRACRAE